MGSAGKSGGRQQKSAALTVPLLCCTPVCCSLFSYPSYEVYLERVAAQRTRESAVSYLSAKDARIYESELAEEALTNEMDRKAAAAAAASSAASSSSASAAASSAAASSFPAPAAVIGRDYKPLEHTCWVKSRVLSYLSATPAASQDADSIKRFMSEAQSMLQRNALASARAAAAARGEEFTAAVEAAAVAASADVRLTTCELLQLVNLRPSSLVEIHRSIEECEERLSEDDALALLQLIQTTLPPPPNARAVKAQDDEGEDEQQGQEQQGEEQKPTGMEMEG